MKLGILNADDVLPVLAAEFGEYPEQIADLLHRVNSRVTFTTYDVLRQHYPVDIDEQDGYIITGSRFSVYDDEEWIRQLMEFVRTLFHHGKKMVGICFGHQLIAHALGGETRQAEAGWGIGVHSVSLHRADSELGDAGESIRLLVSHRDQVITPAHGAEVIAGSEFCPNAICQIDERMLSFQGHPEFVTGYARGLLELRRKHHSKDEYQRAMDSFAQPTDELKLAHWVVDFFQAPGRCG